MYFLLAGVVEKFQYLRWASQLYHLSGPEDLMGVSHRH